MGNVRQDVLPLLWHVTRARVPPGVTLWVKLLLLPSRLVTRTLEIARLSVLRGGYGQPPAPDDVAFNSRCQISAPGCFRPGRRIQSIKQLACGGMSRMPEKRWDQKNRNKDLMHQCSNWNFHGSACTPLHWFDCWNHSTVLYWSLTTLGLIGAQRFAIQLDIKTVATSGNVIINRSLGLKRYQYVNSLGFNHHGELIWLESEWSLSFMAKNYTVTAWSSVAYSCPKRQFVRPCRVGNQSDREVRWRVPRRVNDMC